jgi:hypothetical protein
MPRARHASIAGRITSSSSLPMTPCSPACGFRPATASLGREWPKRGSSAAVSAIVASSSPGVRARGTSASGMWTVASTTRSSSA